MCDDGRVANICTAACPVEPGSRGFPFRVGRPRPPVAIPLTPSANGNWPRTRRLRSQRTSLHLVSDTRITASMWAMAGSSTTPGFPVAGAADRSRKCHSPSLLAGGQFEFAFTREHDSIGMPWSHARGHDSAKTATALCPTTANTFANGASMASIAVAKSRCCTPDRYEWSRRCAGSSVPHCACSRCWD